MFLHIITRKTAKERGLVRYFTGKPCLNNHVNSRKTSSGSCRECDLMRRPLSTVIKLTPEQLTISKKENEKRWYEKNKEIAKKRAKQWKAANPEKVRESGRRWRKKTTSKSIGFMRDSLRRVLKLDKNGRTESLLGYTRQELITHIERQFSKGMSWDNYGEWHIDHIESISTLLAQGVEDPSIINCLTNLKPIWAKENLAKNNKVEFLI